VIAQVERVTKTGTLDPRSVAVPSVLVDAVVEAPASHHPQTYAEAYNPPTAAKSNHPRATRRMTHRCRHERLSPDGPQWSSSDAVINLGVGVPELIPAVAAEGGIDDEITQTVESGPVGGSASGGISFRTATGHEALVASTQQFDFYDGGGLDFGFLGMAQIDPDGNINVSRFGSQLPGCGGFINITQNADTVVFCGTLTTNGLELDVGNGELAIEREGRPAEVPRVRRTDHLQRRVRPRDRPASSVRHRTRSLRPSRGRAHARRDRARHRPRGRRPRSTRVYARSRRRCRRNESDLPGGAARSDRVRQLIAARGIVIFVTRVHTRSLWPLQAASGISIVNISWEK